MSSLTERHFTDPTQRIIQQLPLRAHARGVLYVNAESVFTLALWTLIRWERKVGLVALEWMGVDLHLLTDNLDARLSRLKDRHPVMAKDGVAMFSNTGERVNPDWPTAIEPFLALCEAEARKLKHSYVGSEHLLLAIIANADPELSAILCDHDISYECTKATILEVLGAVP